MPRARIDGEDGGDQLFTFTAFSLSQRNTPRTTNALERINEEFRRRTKPRLRCQTKKRKRFRFCGSACCAAAKSPCAGRSAGTI
jgi:hypothetical protein